LHWAKPEKFQENKPGILELKYNPWHDTQDGKFTAAGQGRHFGGEGASGSWGAPKPKPPKAKKPNYGGFGGGESGGGGASGSWDKPTTRAGGGSFGVGGASGSWDKPNTKPPVPKGKQPKREIVKAPPKAQVAVPKAVPKSAVRTIRAGGYNFEADDKDRTIRAYGQLRLQPAQKRSRSAQRNAGKPDRLPQDHGGHFIGRQFGGPEISYNHFAQNARFNNSDYRMLENEWKQELKAGKKVRVDIRASYNKNSRRPDRVIVLFEVNGDIQERSFPNAKKVK
jgi:DNA/RNA non-specific endonuclease